MHANNVEHVASSGFREIIVVVNLIAVPCSAQ